MIRTKEFEEIKAVTFYWVKFRNRDFTWNEAYSTGSVTMATGNLMRLDGKTSNIVGLRQRAYFC